MGPGITQGSGESNLHWGKGERRILGSKDPVTSKSARKKG